MGLANLYSGPFSAPRGQELLNWHLGATGLAYRTPDGTLHVRAYAGAPDSVVESGAGGFPWTDAYGRP